MEIVPEFRLQLAFGFTLAHMIGVKVFVFYVGPMTFYVAPRGVLR